MKSLRYLTNIGVLAICTVFAAAQDSGLGGRDTKDTSSNSRSSSSSSSSSSGRSSSRQDSGQSRDRSSDNNRGSSQSSGQSRDRSSDPSRGSSQSSSQSRDRSSDPSRGSSQNSGSYRDRTQDSRPSAPSQDLGRSRDRAASPRQPVPSFYMQDGGLGRGHGSGTSGGSNSGSSSSSSRDRGNSGSGSPRDNGGSPRDSGSSRSNGGSSGSQGLGRDQSVGRDQNSGRDQGFGRSGSGSRGSIDPSVYQGRSQGQHSQSGNVAYRGSNNVELRSGRRGNFSAPTTFGIIKSPSLENRARREDGPRYNTRGWRTDYCHYNPYWVDSNFWYPNYCFSPFGGVNVVISPWYSYSFLPGYLSCDHVYVTNYRGYWGWNSGVVYLSDNYNYNNSYDQGYDRGNDRNRDLDYSISDLRDGFERRDFRALSRLIPNYGQIAIYRDGRYDYSIDSRDFSDLLNDLSTNADTDRYRILETRTNRGTARISAEHDYLDQWGNRQRVFHTIYLEKEDGRMVIREFGTSNSRVW
jgi:hypothetical protein